MSIQAFLDGLVPGAKPNFQTLVANIADYYRSFGNLSDKQLNVIKITANYQGKTLPAGLARNGEEDHDFVSEWAPPPQDQPDEDPFPELSAGFLLPVACDLSLKRGDRVVVVDGCVIDKYPK